MPTPLIVFLVVLLLIIIFSFHMARVTMKIKKQNIAMLDRKKKEYGSDVSATLRLVSGLPLAEQTACLLFVTDQKLIIDAEGQTFQVDVDRIIAAQPKTDIEIQQEVTSSAGQAIAGALFFGPVGAIIGGRTKTKKHRVVTSYFIINYTSQTGEVAVIAFEGYSHPLHKALGDLVQQHRTGAVTNL
jgi:hypothetical protein